jgi:two-component system OmpR family response regulator
MTHVLVVEDDGAVADIILARLSQQGYSTRHAVTGRDALACAQAERFDLITLDRLLPDMDGLALLGRLRAEQISAPVLVLSSLGDVDERIAGLRAGGDDYMVKPFSPDELAMRAEVLLRRGREYPPDAVLRVGELELDLIKRQVWLSGEQIPLLHKEFRLLEFMARHPGRTISRQLIFEQVWGYFFEPTDNLVNVHISKLRRKLERPGRPSPIRTIKGEGYCLDMA